jgi:hypothetical protein
MQGVLKWAVKSLGSNAKTERGTASVGFVVPERDRNKYFANDGTPVRLHLLHGPNHTLVELLPPRSFWAATIELTRVEIRRWVDKKLGLQNWSESKRPKVLVWPLSPNCFAILGFEDDAVGPGKNDEA